MKTVWKYTLAGDEQTVLVPQYSRWLSAQEQAGQLVIWFLVDPAAPKVARIIRIHGTGHETVQDGEEYIATVQQGEFAWHLFMVCASEAHAH